MKFTLVIFFLFFIIGVGYTQQKKDTIYKAYVGSRNEEIEFHSISKIKQLTAKEFQGRYHFGASESESDLSIIFSNNKLFAKDQYGFFEDQDWIEKTDRVNIKYDNDKKVLLFENSKRGSSLYKCTNNSNLFLKKGTKGIGFSFTEIDNGQIYLYVQFNEGKKIKTIGKYPESSFVKLTNRDLITYTKYELKIMRNEIFARNGYVFKKDGEMDNYFSGKGWYRAIRKTRNPNLSDIEKHNVNLILKLEKQ